MRQIILLFVIVVMNIQLAKGQQWIDKKYTYESQLNVPYGTALNFNGELVTLYMDIYLPICSDVTQSSKRPLLMWVHGGSFIAGDKNDQSIQAMCKEFAKRGYVTASIDYRLGFISDELAWQCNFPNYNCVFATDSIEWARAYYRAVQDGKGALRYLINRNEQLGIDTDNVFVAGESAGAFTALGVGLLDTPAERPLQTYKMPAAPMPNANALNCGYNQGISFSGDSIARPDLGDIDGDIEPTGIPYTIKGIGNMYGAMIHDLLKESPANKPKPAIYSFHQPCDIVVPIDENYVNWGVSWCLTNGYGCYGITNNKILLYGSRAISKWNSNNNYGYTFKNDFTNVSFPYNFLFGQGSCADQINNPCHAYDNRTLRENNLAIFFSDKITTHPICDPAMTTSLQDVSFNEINVYPNPVIDMLQIEGGQLNELEKIVLYDVLGAIIYSSESMNEDEMVIDMSSLKEGLYFIHLQHNNGAMKNIKIVKN